MKQIFLLPIAFLTLLTACQEPSQLEKDLVKPLVYREKKEYKFEISSPLVVVTFATLGETPALPAQITVEFEKQSARLDHLRISDFEIPDTLLYSRNREVLYFGCHTQAGETNLPQKIDALKVVLCGKINIPSSDFNLKASFLELRDAEINTVAADNEPQEAAFSVVTFSTANLTLVGSNKLTLQGTTYGRERTRAPSLSLQLGNTFGEGTLKIFSRSSVTYEKF